MCPARPDPPPDVLPLTRVEPKPAHPLEDLNGTGKAKKGRRRRSPESEPDPRDRMMLLMLERIQGLNAAVAELTERVLLGAVRDQVHLRRIERLEERCLEAVQEPPGATDAPGADRSDVPTSQTP